ncbi:MAG: hypothetical protein ACHQAX_06095 [Gammaproteobacteria bacterium]
MKNSNDVLKKQDDSQNSNIVVDDKNDPLRNSQAHPLSGNEQSQDEFQKGLVKADKAVKTQLETKIETQKAEIFKTFKGNSSQAFKAAVLALSTSFMIEDRNPKTLISDALSTMIDHDGQTLLDHALNYDEELTEEKKEIFTHLFKELGKHLIDGTDDNDPLLRASKKGNTTLVELLMPHYIKLGISYDKSGKSKIARNRIVSAVDQASSFNILDSFEKMNNVSVLSLPSNDYASLVGRKINPAIQKRRKELQKNGSYWNKGAMTGGAIGGTTGIALVGVFVGVSYLADYCTHQYSNDKFNASEMFTKMADWMWNVVSGQAQNTTHSDATATCVLAVSSIIFTLGCAAIGAAAGSKKLKA